MGNANGRPAPHGGSITRREVERIQRRFKRLSHGTDRASILELTADPALARQPFAARLLQLHDGDGDGVLTQAELLAAVDTLTRLTDPVQRSEFAFRVYDTDGDGFISEAELEAGMRRMVGRGMADEQLAAIAAQTLAEHDSDGDGRLSLEEFRDLLSAATGDGPKLATAAH